MYKPIIDDKCYYYTAPTGYRSAWMPQDEAVRGASGMAEQAKRNGWRMKIRVFYRDGSEVAAFNS